MSSEISEVIEGLFGSKTSVIARDLKLNFQRILGDGALSPEEGALALLATATSVDFPELCLFAKEKLIGLGVTEDLIGEAAESAAMMSMLNIYYRTRHFLTQGDSANVETNYKTAGLRMTGLAKPLLGKDRFEMLAFAVSCLNGCESCVNAHETELREAGVDPAKIHDLMKLAAVVKGLKTLAVIK